MKLVIVENDNINVPAVKKVEQFLPEIQQQTRAFDRNNSQTTLAMMSLTMLNGQSPMRMLRQIAAESEKRTMALNEAQFNLAKKEEKVRELEAIENRTNVEEAELRMERTNGEQLLNKVNGAIKDLATLAEAYDNIKAKHKIESWDEETFEQEEKKHHIRRGFELLYRNLVEVGRAKEATIEYLQQYGVLIQVALVVTKQFIEQVDSIINNGEYPHANLLEDWLDKVATDFIESADITSERLFGKKDFTNKEHMLKLTGGKE
jgi:Tfp pilus assembly protein PilX